jgi:A1 cistron-splicing factor AAR2
MQKEFDWQLDGSYLKRGMLDLEDGERVEVEIDGADEDDELGDYAPTIVDLTPEQLKMLNGSADEESEEEADIDDMDTRY